MTNDADWKEVRTEPYAMPEGYLNNLTEEHQGLLYDVWQAFFSVCDRASGNKEQNVHSGFKEDWGVDGGGGDAAKKKTTGGGGGTFGAISNMTKVVGKSGVEKDDDAKAAAQARAEEANMERLLSTYGPEALRNAFWGLCKRDDPDITMLRFLRARKWNVDATIAMLASTLKWRLDTNLDTLLENGDLGNGKTIPKYIENFDANDKVFSLGTNNKQQPVMYVRFGLHVIWAQPQETTKKFIIAHFELVRLLVVPPNDKILLLFDCTGFGPSNMDITNLLYILQCLQSYFPETLASLYLHKAPWILQQAWHLVKFLLDPVVRAKVRFTNKAEELMEDIPREHLIKYIGGDVDKDSNWAPPVEGENEKQEEKGERARRWNNHRRLCNGYEQVTRAWASSRGAQQRDPRRTFAKKLRLSHFDYEPFWLGLWVHHRNGDLSLTNPGMVRWQYPLTNGQRVRHLFGHETSRKTLLRELQEIAVGMPVDEAEARTKQLLDDEQWGDWQSCDDLPQAPTGYSGGQLLHDDDGGAAASIDPIGLDGPETLEEAKMHGGGGSGGGGGHAKARQQQQPQAMRHDTDDVFTDAQASTPVAEKPAPVVARKQPPPAASSHTNGPLANAKPTTTVHSRTEPSTPAPPPAKKGFFGSLKSKIAA